MSIGEALAEARRQSGLTVAQVSQRTRIRQVIIRAIEGDDYSPCGGDFYARGHIRSIAKVVRADPGPLIREYDTAHRAPGPISATAIDELVTLARTPRRRRLIWTMVTGLALVVALGFVAHHFFAGSGQGANAAPAAEKHVVTHHNAGRDKTRPVPKTSPGAVSSHPTGPARTLTPVRAASSRPTGPARTLTPVRAAAFGPGGAGQGDNPQRAHLAIDGRHATAWRTDWYTTARFGNLYSGTGLLLDVRHPVTITDAWITLGSGRGASLQIRVGAAPELADMRPVARAAGPHGVVHLRFSTPAHGRYVLLWFTRLPADPAGTFQASVYNVRLQARV